MRQQCLHGLRISISLIVVWMLLLAVAPTPSGLAGTPTSVNKLTVAMDGWGSDMIDPWEYPQPSFIQSYLNLRLATRDENMQVQPPWAVEWSQNERGIDIKLHPKAVCQNGETADAGLLKTNLQGMMGLLEGFKGGYMRANSKG